jgi:hypothetical protein
MLNRSQGTSVRRLSHRSVLGVLVALNVGIAAASPRWEQTNAAGREQGVAIAVCLPGDEVVCIGIGCRDPDSFDFVEMIVGT